MRERMEGMHGRTGGYQSGAFEQLRQIDERITQQASQAVRDQLQQKSGAEFDEAYLACQIGMHTQMKASLQVIQNQTSGQLSQLAQETEPKVEQHLQQAEQLKNQLAQNPTNRRSQ